MVAVSLLYNAANVIRLTRNYKKINKNCALLTIETLIETWCYLLDFLFGLH